MAFTKNFPIFAQFSLIFMDKGCRWDYRNSLLIRLLIGLLKWIIYIMWLAWLAFWTNYPGTHCSAFWTWSCSKIISFLITDHRAVLLTWVSIVFFNWFLKRLLIKMRAERHAINLYLGINFINRMTSICIIRYWWQIKLILHFII